MNDETGAVHCIGSREELAALTGTLVDDLHREFVDDLTFTKDEVRGLSPGPGGARLLV